MWTANCKVTTIGFILLVTIMETLIKPAEGNDNNALLKRFDRIDVDKSSDINKDELRRFVTQLMPESRWNRLLEQVKSQFDLSASKTDIVPFFLDFTQSVMGFTQVNVPLVCHRCLTFGLTLEYHTKS